MSCERVGEVELVHGSIDDAHAERKNPQVLVMGADQKC